jgi:hypothetical protein
MPTTAATLSLNVPAITGLLAGVTINSIVTQVSALGIAQGTNALTCLTANSGNWQSTYTTVKGNSANWYSGINSINSFLDSTSGNWQNSYTTTNANSANWQNSYTTVNTTSSIYISLSSTVTQNLTTWNAGANASSTVIANSGYWQNAYVTVSANQGAWGLNAGGIRGPYSVISTGTILPISGAPVVSLNTGSYNVITGGLSGTNSGNYNALVGGYRNYISGGNYNFIGTGGYNHIGGYSTTSVLTARITDPTFGTTSVLSGNGTCTKIFDAQGNNFSGTYSVGDVVGIAYTTNAISTITAVNTPFITGVIQAVNPTNNSNCFGSVVIQGVGGTSLDLSLCRSTSLSAISLYMYDQTYNASSVGGTIHGGYLNTASGNYSTVGGGLYNYAFNGATVGGGARNCAVTNSFIGGGCGNWSYTPGSVIAAGSFNKTGGNSTYTSTGILSSNGTCTLITFSNINGVSAFNSYDPVTVVSVGTNGLSAGSVTTATVINRFPNTPGVIVTGNYSTASCVAAWDRAINNNNTFNAVGGGVLNTASGGYSVVAGGLNNSAIGKQSAIVGGSCNTASGYSFIAAGSGNNTNGLTNAFILGSNITAPSGNFTYVNNLSSGSLINVVSAINIGSNLSQSLPLSASPIINFDSSYAPLQGTINKINLWGGSYGFGIAASEISYVGSNHIFYPYTGVLPTSALSAAMIISSNGNVGIGNNTFSKVNLPPSQNALTVAGNVSASGNIIATGNILGGTGITNIGTATTYTVQLSDNGVMVASTNNTTGLTATVVGSNYPTGFSVGFMQLAGSNTTGRVAVSGSSITINQSNGYFRTTKQYSTATLMYFGASSGWVLFGDLSS